MMASKANQRRVITHDEFIDRIRKSLYFGSNTLDEEDMEISRPLAEYASELFSEPHKGHSLNRLNYVAAGSVHATPCSLIMALIYLDRLNVYDPGYARLITPQELFIVSMMISTKFFAGHDEEIYLSDWAEDGNMTEERLKQLELEFLSAIGWNIYISNEQFFNKLNIIEKTLARREGLRRGWLTYSELMHMLPSFTLAKFLLNNITVMAVSYAASVMTIAGAFFLVSQIPGNALHTKSTTSTENLTIDGTILPMNNDAQVHGKQSKSLSVTGSRKNATCNDAATSAPASCPALNVEFELLKLEQQYREEASFEDLRRRNNEIESESRLTLAIAAQNWQNRLNHNAYIRDTQRNWFAIKEEYSDGKRRLQHREYDLSLTASMTSELATKTLTEKQYPCFIDCLNHLNNGSSFMFWQLLADAAQQSFARLPSMWFKFI